jgi:hypothetical protein
VPYRVHTVLTDNGVPFTPRKFPAEPGDPQQAGHHALARGKDGADQQQLGVVPRPLLQAYRGKG